MAFGEICQLFLHNERYFLKIMDLKPPTWCLNENSPPIGRGWGRES
jgi:hypothetical protein